MSAPLVGDTMTEPEAVTFYSEGTELAGRLYRPDGGERSPGIVICHGFMGVQDWIVPDYAAAFADAGYVALTFDYRGLGDSGGERGLVSPRVQVKDVRNAITYLETRDEVASERIGLYGQSFGGAVACDVAALDSRPKATVCSIGFGDGERWLRDLRRRYEWLDFRDRLAEHRRHRVRTGESERVDPITEIMVPNPERDDVLTGRLEKTPEIEAKTPDTVPLDVAERTVEWKPVERIARTNPGGLLWIVAGRDSAIDPQQSYDMYEHASEPKAIVELEGLDHHEVHTEGFAAAVENTVMWFDRHL